MEPQNFTKKFDYETWYWNLFSLPEYWRNLKWYVYNEKAVTTHVKHQEDKRALLEGKEISIVDFDSHQNIKITSDRIEKAFLYYSNQMIVIFSTYLELIIKDFFEVFFYYKPETKRSIKRGIKPKIIEIENLCGYSFDEKLKDNLKILVERRNELVHENKLFYNVDDIIIDRISENIRFFLSDISKALKKNNIPIIDDF